MSDTFIILDEPAVTDKKLDAENIDGGSPPLVRERVQLGGSALAEVARIENTSPAGSDYGLITRNIPRKSGSTLTTTPLAGSGTYTQSWQDSNGDGATFVAATARADQASGASGFVLEETDDDTDANFTKTVNSTSVSASATTSLYGVIRGKKWRVRYVNGGSAQASFKLTAVVTTLPMFTTDASGVQQVGGTVAISGTVPVSDGGSTLSVDDGAGSLTIDGSVAVSSLPSLPAGTNNIGDVDVLTLPALPAGTNDIGNVKAAGYKNTDWTSVHEPAANTQATTTKAAAGVGVKNVCTGFTVTFAAQATAPAAVQVAVRLRDGASGVGTVLWAGVISLPAIAGTMAGIARQNLWIEGTTNTAMTLEFSAAGGANTIQTVSMEGTTI